MAAFELTSPDLKPDAPIPQKHVYNGFGMSGDNVSPALAWKNPPAGTRGYALTCYDPDAPTGSGWWHWVVVNLPASATGLPAGAGNGKGLPAGALQVRNDYGEAAYGGPAPPPGKPHRYVFTVFALKEAKLDVPANASCALAGFMINANTLAKASFTALYGR